MRKTIACNETICMNNLPNFNFPVKLNIKFRAPTIYWVCFTQCERFFKQTRLFYVKIKRNVLQNTFFCFRTDLNKMFGFLRIMILSVFNKQKCFS